MNTLSEKLVSVYEAVGLLVAVLASIIILFTYLAEGDFSILKTVNAVISWILVAVLVTVGSIMVGYLNEKLKATLK